MKTEKGKEREIKLRKYVKMEEDGDTKNEGET